MSTLSQFGGGGIKSVQRGTISVNCGSGSATNTATISTVDTAKSILSHLGMTTATSNVNGQSHVALTNATTVTASASGEGATYVIAYQVVEYY